MPQWLQVRAPRGDGISLVARSIVFVGGPSPLLFSSPSLPLQEVVEGAKKPTEDGSEAGGSL